MPRTGPTLTGVARTLASEFVVSPGPVLIAWSVLISLALLAGAITAAKGRWRWVLIGLLTGAVPWLATAFLAARPDSLWARVFYDDDKRRRAREQFG
jgi:hypothetical protein